MTRSDKDPRTAAADGRYTTGGIPHGYTSLTPFLAIQRAKEALEFYRDVFAARIISATEVGDLLVHAEIDFGQGRLQLGEPNPAYGLVPPPEGDGACCSLGLYCADADAVVERAITHGATVREPPTTFVSGDRYASIRDPYGIRWSIMTRVEDLSDEESARRVAEWAAVQG